MTTSEARRLLGAQRVARLATVAATGRPHVVPFCFVLDGDVVYSAVDEKPKTSHRLRRLDNVRASGVAEIVADHYVDGDWTQLWWVRASGPARIVDDAAERRRALRLLTEKYVQYRREPPRGAVLAVDVERWSMWTAAPRAPGGR